VTPDKPDDTEDVPMLPEGCGYMGYDFGANYLDSQCFGGQLYDLDNGEGGVLNEPAEFLPCPICNPSEAVEHLVRVYIDDIESETPEQDAFRKAVDRLNVVRAKKGAEPYVPEVSRGS
jgi:hypothetical protein